MDTMRLEALKAEHAQAPTEYERASIEVRIWNERGPGAGALRGAYVAAALGVRSHEVEHRARLYACGDTVAPLWERLDRDMTIATAVALAIRTKRSKRSGESIYQSMERTLAEYDALPNVVHLPNGKVIRKKRAARLEEKAVVPGKRPAASTADTDRTFWQSVRAIVGPELHRRLLGQSEHVVLTEVRRFETELKTLFEQTAQRCKTQKNGALSDTLLKRRVGDACRTLKVDPPAPGTPVSPQVYRKWQRQFKAAALQYHPDTHGGSDVTRPQYEATLEAWAVLQQYYEFVSKKGT
jgi:hypothetical protein